MTNETQSKRRLPTDSTAGSVVADFSLMANLIAPRGGGWGKIFRPNLYLAVSLRDRSVSGKTWTVRTSRYGRCQRGWFHFPLLHTSCKCRED